LTAIAMRHFQSRNLELVAKDIAEIEGLPDAGEGDRPALVAALRWLSSALGVSGEERSHYETVVRVFEDETAASCFLQGLTDASKLRGLGGPLFAELPPPQRGEAGHLSKAVARAAALGLDVGLSISIPRGWKEPLRRDLDSAGRGLEPRELRTIAEVALRQKESEIAYAASGHGLTQGEPHTARFLLSRAESLPPWESDRIDDCLSAAAELARGHRDMELLGSIVDAGRLRLGSRFGFGSLSEVLDPAAAAAERQAVPDVVRREIEDKDFPKWSGALPESTVECRCSICRKKGRVEAAPFPPPLFEDEEDEGNDDEDIPPEVLDVLFDIEQKYGPSIDPDFVARKDPALALRLEEALARSGLGDGPPPRRKRRSKRKRKRRR
ncbi:MAG: hypothetical protein ACRD1Z_00565, partial [Vicinamibacteria bacterium]